MIRGANIYTSTEVNEILSTLDVIIADAHKGWTTHIDATQVCKEIEESLANLQRYIQFGSDSNNFATKGSLSDCVHINW